MHETLHSLADKAPQDFTWITYLWILILSAWGGIASYIGKIKKGITRFSIIEVVGEVVVSGFSGLMTYYICYSVHTPEIVTAVAVGISGHMGARIVTQFEQFIAHKFNLPQREADSKKRD